MKANEIANAMNDSSIADKQKPIEHVEITIFDIS